MQIRVLGPLEVVAADGRVVEVTGRRLRALLTRLAVDAGAPVPVRALAESIWPDGSPADQPGALQSLVSRLRRVLGAGEAGGPQLQQLPAGYRLDGVEVDTARLAQLAATGRSLLAAGRDGEAADVLQAALALWRGEPLPDDDSLDAQAVRAGLSELRDQVAGDRVEVQLRLGRPGDVLAELDALVATHPLREDLLGQRMRALAALGRPAEALAAYDHGRRLLADELGSDPSPQLQALHLELLRQQDGPARPPTNLRAALTSFVGREDDVARVDALLAAGRLVTVVGTGGAGKTRLASEVAARRLDRSPDGVWFVQLAPVADAEDVALAVLDGVGVRDVASTDSRTAPRGSAAAARVLAHLADADCLVVVDNCEHVVDATADLVVELLGACPRVRVVATSREPLGVDGEQLFALTPLALPAADAGLEAVRSNAAVRLLLDRAAAVGGGLQLDERTLEPVVEIVRRLDGLPLAIELAAARLPVMDVSEVAKRLADRFRLLTGGKRTAVARHRTLKAVVEWSWGLLSPVEREVAERCSVFGAGATAAAVAAVCPQVGDDVTDVLQALVDKSLLVVDRAPSGVRFRMLETLREFGSERLAERDELTAVRLAHARYHAALAERADAGLRTRDQLRWLAVLDDERDNLLAALGCLGDVGDAGAALAMATSLGWYWIMRENGQDAARWLAFALAVDGAAEHPLAPAVQALHLMVGLAVTGGGDGDPRARRAELVAAAEGLRGSEARSGPIAVLRPLLLFFGERRDDAVAAMTAVRTGSPDAWTRTAVRSMRIALAENEGDLEPMRRELDGVIAEWEAVGDAWGLAAGYTSRGTLRILDGDLSGARADLELAREARRQLGAPTDDMLLEVRLADLALRAGDLPAARSHVAALRRIPTQGGTRDNREVLAGALECAVAVAAAIAAPGPDAVAELDRSVAGLRALLERAGSPNPFEAHGVSVAWAAVAAAELELGRADAAHEHAVTAYRLGLLTNDLPIVGSVGLVVAELAAREQRWVDAAEVVGATARLRGSRDLTEPGLRRLRARLAEQLGPDGLADAEGRGAGLDRDAAVARLDPALLDVRTVAVPEP